MEVKEEQVAKKFAELSTEEIKSLPEEQAKKLAMEQGWNPNYHGANEKSHTEFMIDGKDELPIVRNNLRKQSDKVEELNKTVADNTKMYKNAMQKQDERHKKELERQIKAGEAKIIKAKADFDVEAATQETENVVTMKNELDGMNTQETKAQEESVRQTEAKVQEWNMWTFSPEARAMETEDPIKYKGFCGEVFEIYGKDKNLSVNEMLDMARSKVNPKKPPNVEGSNPSIKTNNSSKLSASDRQTVLGNIDAGVSFLRNQPGGLSKDAEKKYRKESYETQEKILTQGE